VLCQAIPTAFQNTFLTLTKNEEEPGNIKLDLGVLYIGETHTCATTSIELFDIEVSAEFLTYPATLPGLANCPGVCKYVEFDENMGGQFKFSVRVTRADDVVETTTHTGVLNADADLGSLKIAENGFPTATAKKGENFIYTFLPFVYNGEEKYGWKAPYAISKRSGSGSPLWTYPPDDSTNIATDCQSYLLCTKIKVNTSKVQTVELYVTATSLAGASIRATAVIKVECGPVSTTITIRNFAKSSLTGAWSGGTPVFTLDSFSASKNYEVQKTNQNKGSPAKEFKLNTIARFASTYSSCSLTKFELVDPINIKYKDGECTDGVCNDIPTVSVDRATGDPSTFKVKVTAKGGYQWTSEIFTVNKNCVSMKDEYTYEDIEFVIPASDAETLKIDLPFLNVGDAGRCGIKMVELVDVTNADMLVHPAQNLGVEGCPGAACNFVEVKTSALGTFSFVARATQNDDTIRNT
jgi:hypothetical protein